MVPDELVERAARGDAILQLDLAHRDRQQRLGRALVRRRLVGQRAERRDRLLVVALAVVRIAQPVEHRLLVAAAGVAPLELLEGRYRAGEVALAESVERGLVVAPLLGPHLDLLAVDDLRLRLELP